jgi:hypothetical protein
MRNGFVFIVFLLVFSTAKFGIAQDLPPVDQRKRDAISEQLQLHPLQEQLLDSVFSSYARQIADVDVRLKAIERDPSLSEEQVVMRMNVLSQEKTDLRNLRELDIQALLTPEQKKSYAARIQPSKPAVLHFGIHNRMDCNVCTQ